MSPAAKAKRDRKRLEKEIAAARTESFLLWAEENPAEVLRLQGDAAERDVAELVRAYHAQGRAMRKAGRYHRRAEAMAADLSAAVPF